MKPYSDYRPLRIAAYCTCKKCMKSTSYYQSNTCKAMTRLGRGRARAEGKRQCNVDVFWNHED